MSWTKKSSLAGAGIRFTIEGISIKGNLDLTSGTITDPEVTFDWFNAEGYEAGMERVRPELLQLESATLRLHQEEVATLKKALGDSAAPGQMELPGLHQLTIGDTTSCDSGSAYAGGGYTRSSAENLKICFPVSGEFELYSEDGSVRNILDEYTLWAIGFTGEICFELTEEGRDWYNDVFNPSYDENETDDDRQFRYDVAVANYTVPLRRR